MTPKERAEKSVAAMWSDDRASGWFGMEIIEVDEGSATVALTVAEKHVNGHNICHGGITFSLADSAFAFACNSRNEVTFAQHNAITYLVPARLGDRLLAVATEISRIGRSGITDVRVINQHGEAIAHFRGASRTVGGQIYPERTQTG